MCQKIGPLHILHISALYAFFPVPYIVVILTFFHCHLGINSTSLSSEHKCNDESVRAEAHCHRSGFFINLKLHISPVYLVKYTRQKH